MDYAGPAEGRAAGGFLCAGDFADFDDFCNSVLLLNAILSWRIFSRILLCELRRRLSRALSPLIKDIDRLRLKGANI